MNAWFTIAVTIFNAIYLTALLVFLFLIWRNSTTHVRKMEQTLINVAMMDAESVRKSIDANRDLLADVHSLIALLEKDRPNGSL